MGKIDEDIYKANKIADSLIAEWYDKLSEREKEALFYHSLRRLVFAVANEIFKADMLRRNNNDRP